MKKRVVITGCGIISSIGNNLNTVLESLQRNKSGIVGVPEWAEHGLKSQVAGTIKGFDVQDVRKSIGPKSRYMDISALYVTLAAREALKDSNFPEEKLSSTRMGCIVGSGISSTEPIVQAGLKHYAQQGAITPFDVARCMANSCSANLVNLFRIKGRSYSISSACATSLHNIGHGCELIQNDICDFVIAGGADELSLPVVSMFDGMRTAISKSFNTTPEKASRPYDKQRDGFVISGGGGIVVLETLEHAQERDAEIYGEIKGYGASSDGHDIIQPQSEGNGAYRCMQEALDMAHYTPKDIDYVNTHGTGTPQGDIAEATAIQDIFGHYQVPISSTKSHTGHGMGAAGVHELIYSLLMMKHNFVTASINIDNIDPFFESFNIITENKVSKINNILTNSFGFGGVNACIIAGKV